MSKFWRMMGHYDAETATYSACAGAGQTSPWTPDFAGKLVGLRTQVSPTAATSLVAHVQFKITCNSFKPGSIECFGQGNGLQTAPAQAQLEKDFPVEQDIVPVPITVEARCLDNTPVTCNAYLYGQFVM